MNRSYQKGRAGEHELAGMLRVAGFSVVRTAGSKGPVDLIAWNTKVVRFIQVKREKPTKADRHALLDLVLPPSVSRELWWRLDKQPWQWETWNDV